MEVMMNKRTLKHIIETVPGEAIIHIVVEPIDSKDTKDDEKESTDSKDVSICDALATLDEAVFSMFACAECKDKCADIEARCQAATKLADELWNIADELYDAVGAILDTND